MRFFPDNPEVTTRVRWYFTLPGARFFPVPTSFGSRNWFPTKTNWPLIGEVEGATRQWVNGQPPAVYPGNMFVGPLQYFRGGVPGPAGGAPPRLVNLLPVVLKQEPGGFFLFGSSPNSSVTNRLLQGSGFASGRGTRRHLTNLTGSGFVAGSGVMGRPVET
jgi:hypothetical protein